MQECNIVSSHGAITQRIYKGDTMEKLSKEFAKALLKASSNINAVKKGADNPFFNSKYADLATVMEEIKPALTEAGIAVIQRPVAGLEGCASLETIVVHESGEFFSAGVISVPVGGKKDAQAYGSAITYARRYSLCSIFGVPQVDDDGNEASGNRAQAPVRKQQEVGISEFPKRKLYKYDLDKLPTGEALIWAQKFIEKKCKREGTSNIFYVPAKVLKIEAAFIGEVEA